MAETAANTLRGPEPSRGFPFLTAAAAFATLFAFVGLVVWAYNSPNYLGEPEAEPQPDPVVRLNEVKGRNQALLDGKGAKMPVVAATAELVEKLKTEKDRLPFPAPEPPQPPAPEPKKK
jgi:hypothetical protein